MRTAVATNDDTSMIEVLQIARSEMPQAIKTLRRALERVFEDGKLDAEERTTAALLLPPSPQQEEANGPSVNSSNTGASRRSADMLDREFIETGSVRCGGCPSVRTRGSKRSISSREGFRT
jgi:abelson tyrosine-protein kinase 1